MPFCEICNRPGADVACIRCGRVVCDLCFHGSSKLCVDCMPRDKIHTSCRGISSAGLKLLGSLLIVLGLLIVSLSFVVGGGEGFIFIFPFFFSGFGGWASIVLTIFFFLVFVATSLLPWFLVTRGRRPGFVFSTMRRKHVPEESEAMDYVITIDVPSRLRRTIYIESNRNAVHLRSNVDGSFHRSYRLPEGFDVDEYDYEYEGSYLLHRLKLKRRAYAHWRIIFTFGI